MVLGYYKFSTEENGLVFSFVLLVKIKSLMIYFKG